MSRLVGDTDGCCEKDTARGGFPGLPHGQTGSCSQSARHIFADPAHASRTRQLLDVALNAFTPRLTATGPVPLKCSPILRDLTGAAASIIGWPHRRAAPRQELSCDDHVDDGQTMENTIGYQRSRERAS